MKKCILFLLALALLLPVTADAKRGGDRGTAGTVAAYDEATGELTLALRSGRELTALVTDDTRLRCEDRDEDESDDDDDRSRSRGDDDDRDDDDDRGRGRGPGRGDDDDDCDDAAPTVGATVSRARIDVIGGEAVWTKLKLVG